MYAVIDLETTGGRAEKDRITEIAIVIHDGMSKVSEYSTLIHPEQHIPPFITDITGIDDAMVADAPKFYEVARQVVEMTQGCTFVAHNVGFDYGFLRAEFKRLGYDYTRERLCTVRLSRMLMPGLPTYSLGPLCQRLGIPNLARHRAKGDVDATVMLLEHLLTLQGIGSRSQLKARDEFAGFPTGLDRQRLSMLPEEPGLYFFHDASGNAVHVNSAKNIRQAVVKELGSAKRVKGKATYNPEELCDVTWELTGNELVALLRLDAELAKAEGTPGIRAKSTAKFGVHCYQDQRGYLRLFIDKVQRGRQGIGDFATESDARAALTARLRRHHLCPQLGGIEPGSGACTWHVEDASLCLGACTGKEDAGDYNNRLKPALQGLGLPHPAFFWLGEGRSQDEIAVIGFEGGQLIGFAFLDATQGWDDPAAVKGMLQPLGAAERSTDTVRQYLAKNRMAKLVPF